MTDFDRVKEAADIVEVIGEYVHLKKQGSNYVGLSPWTQEKSASFNVLPGKGFFKDFSSGKGGDVIKFVSEMEGCSMREAMERLAERYGVQIEGRKFEHDWMYGVYLEAQERFKAKSGGVEYLVSRGIREDVARRFGVGVGTNLDNLRGAQEAGLVRNGRCIFLDRITFPIRDGQGRVVAFGGRATGNQQPKYLNSYDSKIYKKSEVIYGLHEAKESIRKNDFCIIVEGYMDVIGMHQAGYGNAVACSGTSFSESQAKQVKRLCQRAVVALDGDKAGRAAVLRVAGPLLAQGVNVTVVDLPEGKDPADCAEIFDSLMSGAKEVCAWANTGDYADKQRAMEDLLSIKGATPDKDAMLKAHIRSVFTGQQRAPRPTATENKRVRERPAHERALLSLLVNEGSERMRDLDGEIVLVRDFVRSQVSDLRASDAVLADLVELLVADPVEDVLPYLDEDPEHREEILLVMGRESPEHVANHAGAVVITYKHQWLKRFLDEGFAAAVDKAAFMEENSERYDELDALSKFVF